MIALLLLPLTLIVTTGMPSLRYSIVDRVLDVPLQSERYSGYFIGAYKTCHATWIAEHALIYSVPIGQLLQCKTPLVRINSACFTGDIFGDNRCDCTEQLFSALDLMRTEPGIVIYHFHHEGRGAGFTSKLQTYKDMADKDVSTFEAAQSRFNRNDLRNYGSAILILNDLGIEQVRLITNNPEKAFVLNENGIGVTEIVGTLSRRPELQRYLKSKRDEQGHFIDFDMNFNEDS